MNILFQLTSFFRLIRFYPISYELVSFMLTQRPPFGSMKTAILCSNLSESRKLSQWS